MAMLTNLDLIRRVPLFALLTPEQGALLADAVAKRRFKRGEMIVEKGKKTNSLFIILAGRARVVITDNKGREVILASLKAGDYIGEMSLIDNDPHSANAENASMAYSAMKGLVQRLRKADEKISSLALMGVYGRVADVLIESATLEGDKKIIHEKISRQDLAKMVGASREMVSRVMRDFEEQGFIQTLTGGAILLNERRAESR